MNRYLRPLAVTCAIIGTALVSFGGACNERTVRGDGEGETGEVGGGENTGPSKHPSLGEGGETVSSRGGGPVEAKPGTFDYTLREGTPDTGKTAPKPPAKATPLSPADTDKLLGRLPPIQMGDGDVVDFALREGSKPPPLTGEQIQAQFPPPVVPDVARPDVAGVKAEVLRYQPEGDVPLAPRITITFATPMVPLTSHDTLAKSAVPAKMTPDIEGNWRWVGTKTLFFDPVGRARPLPIKNPPSQREKWQ